MLPELSAARHPQSLIRLPQSQDVALTPRVKRILDTAPVRRLASISQLGMVSLVYPGATHSRLEHSLGVYDTAVQLLSRFADHPQLGNPVAGEAFLVAALVHDLGHWPFCHPIEDMQLPGLPEHESVVAAWLDDQTLGRCLDEDWQCTADQIMSLLVGPTDGDFASCFYASCLSGPIDVDKLDYLQRDSLHAGVPYGCNFDVSRLIHSLCVHPEKPELAIGEKGRTAAELMVFARYVMFSEVYWHHAVRSATAMLQRSVFLLQNRMDLESTFRMRDQDWIASLRRTAEGTTAEPLVEGLFGPLRVLYKRLAEFDVIDGLDVHMKLARRPYWWLVACSERLAADLASATGQAIHAADIMIDAPPVKLEVDINMDIVRRDGSVRPLGQLSPVASALAKQQFDHHVKRVRVFIRDDLRDEVVKKLGRGQAIDDLILHAVDSVESEVV